MPLGDLIRQLRTDAGMSVRDAAKLIGKTPGYFSRIEVRGEIPSPELLIQIAEALHGNPDELLAAAKEDYVHRVSSEIDAKQSEALTLYRKNKHAN